ncbi:peptide chain release factor 2 [Candidatus Saccharibacteria bacterium]|nr:peptide chain release factor 2 [Candidatus Saccharibacteria bacterium]MBQ3306253.1 peptide chain release factor 2 [Candidatus Saccharibacteria bacterium]
MERELETLTAELNDAWQKLDIDKKIAQKRELEKAVENPELWKNPEDARKKTETLAKLTNETEAWTVLKTQTEDIKELLDLNEKDLEEEIKTQIEAMKTELEKLKTALKFTGPYDRGDAIIRITAGVGGTEAMDWAGMLERMYLRFFEKTNMKPTLLERTAGEEAGIKTAVYEVKGENVYGNLKSEHGVHRLVRLSPFNADNLRQTSFSLVEILPVIEDDEDIKINEKDLRIDTYHSGGHGGQSVNTTNSAIRITHIPTNIVVAIQNERSQLQNKEKAMEILRGKLAQLKIEQNAESLDKLRAGESASWGQQIRNYVMQPYKLVKDTRTKHEETDVDKVLDGKIEPFIDAYLDMILGKKQ